VPLGRKSISQSPPPLSELVWLVSNVRPWSPEYQTLVSPPPPGTQTATCLPSSATAIDGSPLALWSCRTVDRNRARGGRAAPAAASVNRSPGADPPTVTPRGATPCS